MNKSELQSKKYKIHFVKKDDDLQLFVEAMNNKEEIFIDLVFDENRKQYGLKIYSFLLYDGDIAYVFNSHTIEKIEMLWPLFENANIRKVCYSCAELVDFLAKYQCKVKNIYDLQVALTLSNHNTQSLHQLGIDLLGFTTPQRSLLDSHTLNEKYYIQLVNAAHLMVTMELLLPLVQMQLNKLNAHRFVNAEMKVCESSLLEPVSLESFALVIVVETNQADQDSFDMNRILEDLLQFRKPLGEEFPNLEIEFPTTDPWSNDESFTKYHDFFEGESELRKHNFKIYKQEYFLTNLNSNPIHTRERARSFELLLDKKRIFEEKYVPLLQRAIEKFGEHAANYLLRNVKESIINLQFPSHKLHQHQIDIVSLILLELNLDI
jgi:hypothetical protein